MYGHGITTLCLTEMMGMAVSKRQEARIRSVGKSSHPDHALATGSQEQSQVPRWLEIYARCA